VRFRRQRFGDLVARQLDLFAQGEAALLEEAREAERRYDAADAEEAEELYGDYQLLLESIADRLGELRDTYATTLEADAAEEYAATFDRAVLRRHPRLAR
jgi:nitrate reductase assembly molybdenum cofactor insertion protein NarJ